MYKMLLKLIKKRVKTKFNWCLFRIIHTSATWNCAMMDSRISITKMGVFLPNRLNKKKINSKLRRHMSTSVRWDWLTYIILWRGREERQGLDFLVWKKKKRKITQNLLHNNRSICAPYMWNEAYQIRDSFWCNTFFSSRLFFLSLHSGKNINQYRLLTSIKWCHMKNGKKETDKQMCTRRNDT